LSKIQEGRASADRIGPALFETSASEKEIGRFTVNHIASFPRVFFLAGDPLVGAVLLSFTRPMALDSPLFPPRSRWKRFRKILMNYAEKFFTGR